MKRNHIQNFRNIIFTLFVYLSTLLSGWIFTGFYYVFHSLQMERISARLESFMGIQPYLAATGILFFVVLLACEVLISEDAHRLPRQIIQQIAWQGGLIFVLLIDSILYLLGYHDILFELAIFFGATALLLRWGSLFYHLSSVVWHHPTTHGSFVISSLLSGIALLTVFGYLSTGNPDISLLVLGLLVFDLLILYARFRYLSGFTRETRMVAARLMGERLFAFGARIIVGIFMPGINLVYNLLTDTDPTAGIGILILFGTLMDRYLFVTSAPVAGATGAIDSK